MFKQLEPVSVRKRGCPSTTLVNRRDWQHCANLWVCLTMRGFVQKTQHGDISSNTKWCQSKMLKRLNLCDPYLSEEPALHAVNPV